MTLRHDCRQRGCFVRLQMPDWRFLKGAFPRGIEPSDLDGFVEVHGRFLTLEWKGLGADLTDGQRFAFRRRTLNQTDCVFVLYGNAERTACSEMRVIFRGKVGPREPADNARVFDRCEKWAAWAQTNSKLLRAAK